MDILHVFRSAANADKAASMSAYMRNQFVFLGIQTPKRRELSRDFLAQVNQNAIDWPFVFKCWQQPEREFQYLALSYLARLRGILSPADIPHLKKLIVQKSWWDTCDTLGPLLGELALSYPKVNEILLEWSEAENIWLRRAAIIHQLPRKDKTNEPLLEQIIVNNLDQEEFFIAKAIGWSLREYSKTNQSWVEDFLLKHGEKMKPLSVREASKYLTKRE